MESSLRLADGGEKSTANAATLLPHFESHMAKGVSGEELGREEGVESCTPRTVMVEEWKLWSCSLT